VNRFSPSFLDGRPGQALREARSQLARHPERSEGSVVDGQILRRLPLGQTPQNDGDFMFGRLLRMTEILYLADPSEDGEDNKEGWK
jgi:hypothetical protein